MEALSPRQDEIYRFILNYRKDKDLSPTFREIAEGVGLSLAAAVDHIQALRGKRYITWQPHSPRSIHAIRQEKG
jgi:SOS-response transcriptional repressor LexA